MEEVLSHQEIRKYSKHIMLPEIGVTGQEKLKRAKVLVIGAGGIGSPVLQYLSSFGIGTIGIVEYDKVEEDNVQRQILYGEKDIGKLKSIISKQKLEEQNSFNTYKIVNLKFSKENALTIIDEYDIVIDATDNFSARYLINDTCILANKPLIYGSLYKFEGQVTVFNYNNGPSLRCLYSNQPDRDEIADPKRTGILGILAGIVGLFMVNEVIKIIIGYGELLSGKLLIFDIRNYTQYIYSFNKNPRNFDIEAIENIDYKN